MSWTPDRVERLKEMWQQGMNATSIAKELGGGVTRNGVIGKVHRLGLNPSFGERLIEGLTEAITMAKLMRENEELRRERDTAWNDAIEAAAALADASVNKGGMAKSMAFFMDAKTWRGYMDGVLAYSDRIRALRR